jgi:amino acid permease
MTNQFLPIAIIVGGALVLIAVLVVVFSPMLWTDHVLADFNKPVPTGCSVETKPVVQGQTGIMLVHCPSWVQY